MSSQGHLGPTCHCLSPWFLPPAAAPAVHRPGLIHHKASYMAQVSPLCHSESSSVLAPSYSSQNTVTPKAHCSTGALRQPSLSSSHAGQILLLCSATGSMWLLINHFFFLPKLWLLCLAFSIGSQVQNLPQLF